MNSTAANCSVTGPQVRQTRKPSPTFAGAASEWIHNSYTSRTVISRMVAANAAVISRAASSPRRLYFLVAGATAVAAAPMLFDHVDLLQFHRNHFLGQRRVAHRRRFLLARGEHPF